MRKCFDRVAPAVALRTMRWWGASSWLVDLLADFYRDQERWVAVAGVFAPRPVQAGCSLLQGCPFSPLLVNSMMAAWSLHVRCRVPDIRMGIFLDDRTLYTKGTRAVTRLVEAATAGQEADAAMGFALHPDKLASFGCHVQQREVLLEYADVLGVPQTDFLLLGVNYRLEGHQAFAARGVTEALRSRAANQQGGGNYFHASSVGQFADGFEVSLQGTVDSVQQDERAGLWAHQVEAAVWGGPLVTGRSAFLLWTFVGVDLRPEFAMLATVLKKECGEGSPGPQVATALTRLGWRTRGTFFVTQLGTFDAEELTAHGFQERLREACRRAL